ncbi:MAG: hypothetical protein AAF604_03905 [Acidobacteriota bacterium]
MTTPRSPLPPPDSFRKAQHRKAYQLAFERSLAALRRHRSRLARDNRAAEEILARWRRHPVAGRLIFLHNLDEPVTWSLCSLLVEDADARVWRGETDAEAAARLASAACDRLARENPPPLDLSGQAWALRGFACLAADRDRAARVAWRAGRDRQHPGHQEPHLLLLRAELERHAGRKTFALRLLDRASWLFRGAGNRFYGAVARLHRGLLTLDRGRLQAGAALICSALADLDPQRAPLLMSRANQALASALGEELSTRGLERRWLAHRGLRLEELLSP